jgi:[NiFe] hydrogenase assembly HybE family chaperone
MTPSATTPHLRARVAALEAAFTHVAATRMAGVPVMNRQLRVQALGFEAWQAPRAQAGDQATPDVAVAGGSEALGILVTPWFMNLVRLPLDAAAESGLPAVGVSDWRRVGADPVEFIGAHEEAVGRYAAASLFSPMFEFADHATACATAHQVLALLRKGTAPKGAPAEEAGRPRPGPAVSAPPRAAAAPIAGAPAPDPVTARRGFLFGRRSAPGAGA